ncbi:MAG TPA: dephospho-CoA kinase [Capsulimonadaceae bacterium]|jgi:dephospho-CoA kinase
MILGITGGVATGKSTVCATLHALAAERSKPLAVISADAIARDLLDPGTPATMAVIEKFGESVTLAGDPEVIDRRELGAIVFDDEAARRWLEKLLHPTIIQQLVDAGAPFKGRKAQGLDGQTILVMEIPLLFEANLEYLVDRILVTRCSEDLQVERIVARKAGMSEADAHRQINAQMPIELKVAKADYVIDADKPLDEVSRDIAQVLDSLTAWRV